MVKNTQVYEVILRDYKTGTEIPAGMAYPKQFSSGSDGFYMSGKAELPGTEDENGNPARYQLGLNIIRIGSKPKTNT